MVPRIYNIEIQFVNMFEYIVYLYVIQKFFIEHYKLKFKKYVNNLKYCHRNEKSRYMLNVWHLKNLKLYINYGIRSLMLMNILVFTARLSLSI